jgi:hypothetical protein
VHATPRFELTSFALTWPGASIGVRFGTRATVEVVVAWDGRWLVVRDDDAPPPAKGTLDVRSHGLWVSLTCETPGEHWTVGLEAFALGVDDPADERGDLVALGLDIEWEAPGRVHGELLVADARIELDEPAELVVS